MKHLIQFWLIGWLIHIPTLAINQVLFQIGEKNGSAVELAMAPNQYQNFLLKNSGVKTYYVGYSEAKKDWPYVFPGPLDSWGGGGYWSGYHPRHFPIIQFALADVVTQGDCHLTLSFAGINNQSTTRWRVEINGIRFEKDFQGKSSDRLLIGEEAASPTEWTIDFPATVLKKGMNQIQLGLIKGNWCMFDQIRLETPDGCLLQKASSSLIRSVQAAPFEYERNGERYQPVLVDLIQYDKLRTLTFETEGIETCSRTIEPGESVQEIWLPAVKSKRSQNFRIKADGKVIYTGQIIRSPQPLHSYADDVDILMGTGNSRWMFKASVSLPFGMVQISPDNENETWKSGYEYTIENISGFNHFCDWTIDGFLMQPTCGTLQVNPGSEDDPDSGYRSRIDKKSECAEVGKYSVFMTDTKIKAEVSATRRASIQAYTFPKRDDARILVDLFAPSEYLHNLQDVQVKKISDTEIEGYATYFGAYTGYTLEQYHTLYFVMQFDKPFESMGGWINDQIKPNYSYVGGWNNSHDFKSEPKIMENLDELRGKRGCRILFKLQDR